MRAVLRLVAVMALLVVACSAKETFTVPSCSMAPTMKPGAKVQVKKADAYERANVVVFRAEDNTFVARVVGLPGEKLESVAGRVHVNGAPIDEPYLVPDMTTTMKEAVVVPDRSYFLLGDNRTNSADSRFRGSIAHDAVVGRAVKFSQGDGDC